MLREVSRTQTRSKKQTIGFGVLALAILTLPLLRSPAATKIVTGRVLDKQGKPIPKAAVDVVLLQKAALSYDPTDETQQLQKWHCETDHKGGYTITDVKPEGKLMFVKVAASGFIPGMFFVPADVFTSGKFDDLKLRTGVTLKGRCVGPDGKPVSCVIDSASANVNKRFENAEDIYNAPIVSTDALGRFELTVPEGMDTEMAIYSDRWFSRHRTEAGTLDQGDIPLQAGTRIVGKVLTEEGKPVAGCIVLAYGLDSGSLKYANNPLRVAVKTDGAGGFQLPALIGNYNLSLVPTFGGSRVPRLVTAAPKAVIVPVLQHVDGKQEKIELTLRTAKTMRISGKMVEKDGKPVKDVEIRLSGTVADGRDYTNLGEIKSDAEGKYNLKNIPKGMGSLWLHITAFDANGQPLVAKPLAGVQVKTFSPSSGVRLEGPLDQDRNNMDFELQAP